MQYAKVAEYQRRGLVRFHALIRFDGPRTPEGFGPAPAHLTADLLARLVHDAAATVTYTAPSVHSDDPIRVLAFGTQVDARPVRASRRTDDPSTALTLNRSPGTWPSTPPKPPPTPPMPPTPTCAASSALPTSSPPWSRTTGSPPAAPPH